MPARPRGRAEPDIGSAEISFQPKFLTRLKYTHSIHGFERSSFLESTTTFPPPAGIGSFNDQSTPCTTKRRYSGNCQLLWKCSTTNPNDLPPSERSHDQVAISSLPSIFAVKSG